MPGFPVLQKSWRLVTTRIITKTTVNLQQGALVVALKNAFVAPALSSPWILKGSCDSVSFNTSGIDLWIDETKIVPNAAGAHSWVWLRNVAGVELVIDCNQSNNSAMSFVWSPAAGFSGGSTTARPTATDEQARLPTAWASASTGQYRLNLIHSTDGKTTYAFILFRGIVVHACLIGDAFAHHSAWNPSTIFYPQGSNSNASTGLNTQTLLRDFDSLDARAAGGRMLLRWTNPYLQGQQLEIYQSRDARSGKWPFWSIGLICLNAPRRGKHGRMIDLFKVPQSTPPGWLFRSDDKTTALMSFGAGWCMPWPVDAPVRVF